MPDIAKTRRKMMIRWGALNSLDTNPHCDGFLSPSLHGVWLFFLLIAPMPFMIFTEVNLLKKFQCRVLYPPRAKRGHKRYMEHWGTFCSEFFTEPSRYFARGKTPHTKCIRGGFIEYAASSPRWKNNFRFFVTIASWCLAISYRSLPGSS